MNHIDTVNTFLSQTIRHLVSVSKTISQVKEKNRSSR